MARINTVLSNWQSKNLKFNNEDLRRVLSISFSEVKNNEIDLKLFGQDLITLLNLFNRAHDSENKRLSDSRLKELNIDISKNKI